MRWSVIKLSKTRRNGCRIVPVQPFWTPLRCGVHDGRYALCFGFPMPGCRFLCNAVLSLFLIHFFACARALWAGKGKLWQEEGSMRRATTTAWIHWAGQLRMYRTPLGGTYFEQPLPSSLGASRAKGKEISTAHITMRRREQRKEKKPLSVPLTAEGLRGKMRQIGEAMAVFKQRRADGGEVRIAEDSHHETRQRALHNVEENEGTPMRVATEISPVILADKDGLVLAETGEQEEEGKNTILPGSSVLGSDLDRLEREMMRDYHQRGKELPHFDRVCAAFGSGKRSNKPYHVLAEEYRQKMAVEKKLR
ncbi:hypothetical protein MOQ_004667 [Trypanosoma cruzi marinkellei]|uniref:Uncharacterized protein n=1 Tax=Trypanosoma cruzi marinkellei TaxID=85056 RepID=K2N0G6_TRYCR|nr:hypothetical protein MOQ_004667 [Trypanosoma cruzi marinkellei]